MRLTRCRLRYRGNWESMWVNWKMSETAHTFKITRTFAPRVYHVVLWCSGYHICLTRRRSPVRNRAAPFLAFFLIPISGFGKKKWREEEAKWTHQMRLQHVH